VLFAVAVGVHLPAVGPRLPYDDQDVVLRDARLERFDPSFAVASLDRPTRAVSLMVDRALFGERWWAHHLQNLALHGAAALLLFRFAVLAGAPIDVSFLASLLFAVHPVHVETVASVANRKEQLALVFLLSAAIAYGGALHSGGRRRVVLLLATLAGFVAAAGAKETAIALPILLAVLEWTRVPRERRILTRFPRVFLGLVVAALVVAAGITGTALDLENLHSEATFGGFRGSPTLSEVWATAPAVFLRYLGLFAWPAGLCPDHALVPMRFGELRAVAALLLAVLALAGLGGFARRRTFTALALAWFLAFYLPVSHALPVVHSLAERYLYLPSAGLCLLAATFVHDAIRTLRRRRSRTPAFALGAAVVAAVVALGALTIDYARAWRDPRALWDRAVQACPLSFRAWANRAVTRLRDGDVEGALSDLGRSIDLEPRVARTHYDRGTARIRAGAYADAVTDFDRALSIDPGYAMAYNNRGVARHLLGDRNRALADYERALEIDATLAQAHFNAGRVYDELGYEQQALDRIRRAASLGSPEAVAFLEERGD